MKRIICPKHSKKNTLCLQIYLKINQARVQDEKQLGDKLQCVCYIVGNGFIECWLAGCTALSWQKNRRNVSFRPVNNRLIKIPRSNMHSTRQKHEMKISNMLYFSDISIFVWRTKHNSVDFGYGVSKKHVLFQEIFYFDRNQANC